MKETVPNVTSEMLAILESDRPDLPRLRELVAELARALDDPGCLVTRRGYRTFRFRDANGRPCSLQESSLTKPRIWLGIDNPEVKIMRADTPEGGTGWVDVPLPERAEVFGRMHLSVEMVRALLPQLERFTQTGRIG